MKKESKTLTRLQILLICGDCWHAPACANYVLHALCEEFDYSLSSVFSHHDVPWDDFANFDVLILDKEGRYSHPMMKALLTNILQELALWQG